MINELKIKTVVIYIMNDVDKERLNKALENDDNISLLNLTRDKIAKDKNDILQQLQFNGGTLKGLNKKLKQYRYIDELNDIKFGSYIRWINISNPKKMDLTTGAIVCEIKLTDSGTQILCKNSFNRFMQLKMDECVIFQKINDQENIIINVYSYLSK